MSSDKKQDKIGEYKKELRDLLGVAAKSPNLLAALLDDILSPREYEDLAKRWQLIRLLHSSKSQRAVRDMLGVSVSRVSRGAHMLKDKQGGFNKIINILKIKKGK